MIVEFWSTSLNCRVDENEKADKRSWVFRRPVVPWTVFRLEYRLSAPFSGRYRDGTSHSLISSRDSLQISRYAGFSAHLYTGKLPRKITMCLFDIHFAMWFKNLIWLSHPGLTSSDVSPVLDWQNMHFIRTFWIGRGTVLRLGTHSYMEYRCVLQC